MTHPAVQPAGPDGAPLPNTGQPPALDVRRSAWKHWLPVLLGVLLLIAAAGWVAVLRPLRDPAPLPVPARLADLPLTWHAFGKQAASQVAHLHGKGFPLTGAAVAEYGDGASTVWVARSWGRWGAQRLVQSMTATIADGTSPFTPTGQRTVDGCTVYTLTGMGMSHFYFQADDWVIWLAAMPDQAERALEDLLAFTEKR